MIISPVRFQEAPPGIFASQSVCGGPPDSSILFILPSLKKPSERLSGDQNGDRAPSVPGSAWAVKEFSGRIYSSTFPLESAAPNASRCPSGETEKVTKFVFS